MKTIYTDRSRPKPTKDVWVTKHGEQIPVKEMSDNHLENTIRFLIRQVEKYQQEGLVHGPPPFQGEIAQYYAEQEYYGLIEADPYDILSASVETWDSLIEEAQKRGIPL